MASVFARFTPRLQEAIVARLGWTSLRPVQELAGQALLDGANAVVLAPTAGGKTEAAMFPALSRLIETGSPHGPVGIVYVAPTRALLNNQAERLGAYTEMVGLERFLWHGETPEHARRRFLAEPSDVLMTTPESLEVLLLSRRVDEATLFRGVQVVIVDEVHALAGTDRGSHLASVLERLAVLSREDIQRVGLSATVGNPADVLAWLSGTSKRPGVVVDPPRSKVRREVRGDYRLDTSELAGIAASMAAGQKSFVFCEARSTAERVADEMALHGTQVLVHHSSISPDERLLAEAKFTQPAGDVAGACIVCTSTLELGIDVGDLDRVMQIDAPQSVSSFLQRMGRTGRREGQTPNTTFLCSSPAAVLQAVAVVELARAGWVESVRRPDRAWAVFIHQLVALALKDDGVRPEAAWEQLSRVPDFAAIRRAEYDRLVAWLLRDGALVLAGGLLVVGPKIERVFGYQNFRNLYSVFESPQSYTVVTTNQQVIGTLDQGFVDMLTLGDNRFLLAGRAWWVLRIGHEDRRVEVEPAPHAKEPSWSDIVPRFVGFELCQAMLAVVTSSRDHSWLSPEAVAVVEGWRRDLAGVVEIERGGLEVDNDRMRWWTFAGGRINATIRLTLRALEPTWKVTADNLGITIQSEHGVSQVAARQTLARLARPETWEDAGLWKTVGELLPSYRLSKFQVLMPPWIVRELLASFLLDVEGALGAAARLLGVDLGAARLGPVGIPDDDTLVVPIDVERPNLGVARDATRPLLWIDTAEALRAEVDRMLAEHRVGLDVETTLRDHRLCLVQIAGAARTWLVDALAVADLSPLQRVLEAAEIVKLIHNASFEISVLRRQGLEVRGVVDTLDLSRRVRGRETGGGHSLRAVCRRELGIDLDKTAQLSDWSRRPLADWQRDYAALDAEILPLVHDRLMGGEHVKQAD